MMVAAFASVLAVGAGEALATGSITGTVDYAGAAPKPAPLNRKSDPYCAKTEMVDETVLTSKDGKHLQNVAIRVKDAPAKPGTGDVVVEQNQCMYRPRVQVATEGQKIMVRNNDGTLHNVHTYEGTKTLFNQAQPAKSKPIEKPIPPSASVLKLKCDVHPWMTGYVVVNKNPYAAVTKEDGSFEIKDVPPGDYTVEAWHEKLPAQTQ
jgi:plastocyanin